MNYNKRPADIMPYLTKKFNKDAWEIKTIANICETIFSGNQRITANCTLSGDIPAVAGKNVEEARLVIKDCKIFVDETLKTGKFIETGDLLTVKGSFFVDNLGKSCVYMHHTRGLAGNNIYVLKHAQNSKYLAYALSSQYIKKQIRSVCGRGIQTQITKNNLNQLKVFLPDLSIQNRIASFLEKWEDLKMNLKEEMEFRDKQYQFYSEVILRSDQAKLWVR